MKRDMELVRNIAIEMENWPNDGQSRPVKIEGLTTEEATYHLGLMAHAGLINAVDASSHDGPQWLAIGLTWEGHEFLDAARSDTIWAKAKQRVLATTGTLTLEALKVALKWVAEQTVVGQ